MLFVVYNYNFSPKFVLILPVFYYYVTPNFFYSPPTFGWPCILLLLQDSLNVLVV